MFRNRPARGVSERRQTEVGQLAAFEAGRTLDQDLGLFVQTETESFDANVAVLSELALFGGHRGLLQKIITSCIRTMYVNLTNYTMALPRGCTHAADSVEILMPLAQSA